MSNPSVPKDKESSKGRQLLIADMLEQGKSYSEIKKTLHVSENTIAKISKKLIRRFDSRKESVERILKERMIAVSAKALDKMSNSLDSESDTKAITSVFNSTFDRATKTINDVQTSTNITIQLANLFGSADKPIEDNR
jgi:GMP synthase PP-ATPase subunit